jgi:hypothetical protein
MSRKAILSVVGLVASIILVVGTFVALYFFQRPPSSPPILLSEVMSSNGATVQDGGGDFSDWVELHNPTSETVSMEGYVLRRDGSDVWVFPAVSIEPGGYLVVWASGKGDSVPSELHTEFRLSRGGVVLELLARDGETRIDYFQVPALQRDRSFGMSADGLGVMCYFEQPTPQEANSLECLDAARVQ